VDNQEKNKPRPAFVVPSLVTNVVDTVGSGDALLAYATLSMISTKSLLISSILGSIAAACSCENEGNIVVTPDLIINKINTIEETTKYKIQNKI